MARSSDLRESIAAYIRQLSGWRRARYDDDLRDPRNLRSADALQDFAAFILALPIDDPRLATLARLASDGEVFVPGQQTAYELGRFHFHDQTMTFDGFLTLLVELAERDAGESGRFGGRQVPGDEPWS
jgi:hypothetical protein